MNTYFSVTPLSPSEFSDYESGRKDGGGEEEEENTAVGAAAASGTTTTAAAVVGAPPTAPSTLKIADFLTVPCSGEAVAAGFAGVLWGQGAARSSPVAAETEALLAAAAGAVVSLQRAILSNAPYIRAALKRPFLPDCPLTRPPHTPLLGSQCDVIAGCKVTVSIARSTPLLNKGALSAVAAAVGGELSALAVAALVSASLPALLPPSPAPSFHLTGGVKFSPRDGVHFFSSPELATASMTEEEAREGGLPEGWWSTK